MTTLRRPSVLSLALLASLLGCGGPLPGDQTAAVRPSAPGVESPRATPARGDDVAIARSGDAALARAYDRRESNIEVEGEGTVAKVLRDDTDGSRHQRFILRLDSKQTLLVAHNIDLSRRIEGLKAGDRVAFRGEYEWNAAGGVLHWTHADPAGRHPAGWLRRDGTTYR